MKILKKNNIISLLLILACIFIGLYYSIGALGEKLFNPLYPYAFVSIIILILVFREGMKESQIKAVAPFLVFVAFGFLTLVWTSTFEYGYTKIFNVFVLNIFFIGASGIILNDFYKFCLYMTFALCLGVVLLYVGVGSPSDVLARLNITGRLGGSGSVGIIEIARFLGFTNLCAFYVFIKKRSKFWRGVLVIIILLSSSYLVFSGTRGGIYGFILATLFLIYFSTTSSRKRTKYVISTIIVAVLIFVLYLILADSILKNFVEERINSKSGGIRMAIYKTTFQSYLNLDWLHWIIGDGSGSASMAAIGATGKARVGFGYFRYYPHNIFLEILYEYGILGIVFFFRACITPFILNLRNMKTDQNIVFLMGFWVFWFFNSLVSSDIMGNFLLFGLSVLLWVNYYSKRNLAKIST